MIEDRATKKAKARAEMRSQQRGKVAICASCNKWFETYQDRNTHRATCPKRKKETE